MRDHRPADRQHDLPPDAEMPQPSMRAASTSASGTCAKNCRNMKMKNGVPEEHRQDQRQDRVDPTQVSEHDEHRDHRDLRRQHHRRDHQHEQRPAPPEAQDPGKRVAHQAARQHGTDHAQRSDDDGVGERIEEAAPGVIRVRAHLGQGFRVVLELRRAGIKRQSPRR
jgi:hypothetical protein